MFQKPRLSNGVSHRVFPGLTHPVTCRTTGVYLTKHTKDAKKILVKISLLALFVCFACFVGKMLATEAKP